MFYKKNWKLRTDEHLAYVKSKHESKVKRLNANGLNLNTVQYVSTDLYIYT